MAILTSLIGSGVVSTVLALINKFVPDKELRDKIEAEIKILEAKGEFDLLVKQIEANAMEAQHPSLFVAGWRPFIGWCCGFAFIWHVLVLPILVFITAMSGVEIPVPEFDMNILMTVLFGMLGMGGLRSFEKFKGVARNKWTLTLNDK